MEIAAQLGFLWRSYHADGGAKIAHVGEIKVGDLIVLAYRRKRPSEFRILHPLVVTETGEHTLPINDAQCPKNAHAPHAPFVLADAWLTKTLNNAGYPPAKADPVFSTPQHPNQHTGLNVKPLLMNPNAEDNEVLRHWHPSPGQNAIWPYLRKKKATNTYYLPENVRNWIKRL